MTQGFRLQSVTAVAAAILRFGRSSQPYHACNCFRICPQFSTNSIVRTQLQTRSDPQFKTTIYDVFVSFRGKDIRQGFISHLVEAFPRKQLHAFLDDKLERGDEISASLLGAIERSSISLIIFSKDYASSHWCLEELEQIIECKEKYGQVVIPVFYHIDPTNVRHQTGSYENALSEQEKTYDSTKVQIWRQALNKSANLSGIKSSDFQNEAELLEEIVKIIDLQLIRTSKRPINSKRLIGIDKTILELELLLRQESKDVRVTGLWGMGGIGKTTIAEEIFKKISFEYEGCCFLANVREELEKQGIISLKKILFSELLDENVKIDTPNALPNYIERRISRKKVLIVLDDLNDSYQQEKIIGNLEKFGSGSRIIVTTRDKQVLVANNVDDIYEVRQLSNSEALDLFKLTAFNKNDPRAEHYELSERAVNYAKGNPLVLKVFGHLLRGKDKKFWEGQLDILQRIQDIKVHNVMKLSYDDLDREEQKILLDLSCFFSRVNLEVSFVQSLLKGHESDNSVAVRLERLKDKALITISEDNIISVHDIIQEMAWKIVRPESSSNLGSQSRLWDPNDIYDVLKNDKGTDAVRSITTQLSTLKNLNLSPHIFAKMSKLQFLDFHDKEWDCAEELERDTDLLIKWKFHGSDDAPSSDLLPCGLQSLPNELRYLRWICYPLKSLPEEFSAEKLVMLDLSCSQVEKLWHGVKNLTNLKGVRLLCCEFLQELPDFSKATNLEALQIWSCPLLTSLHPSIFSLDKLELLRLCYCISLTTLSIETHLHSLHRLHLLGCKYLQEISVRADNLIELNLAGTAITAWPSCFEQQSKLKYISLQFCHIKSLPSSFKNLEGLICLDVNGCLELQILPELPSSLQSLYVSDCISLKTVLFPSTVIEQFKENRRSVQFCNCLELDEESLTAIGLNAQINLITFAYNHLFSLENDHIENYDDYVDNAISYQVLYMYPGSSFPEWVAYKTSEHDYLIIDLSSAPPSPPLGFILFFIFEKDTELVDQDVKMLVIVSDSENEDNQDCIEISTFLAYSKNVSDNVCVMCDQRCSSFLNSWVKSLLKFKIKVCSDSVVLKGFGFSIINTSACHNFFEQMELHDHNISNSSDKWS